MANTIKHKRSSTPGSTPSASDLEEGEIAINTADGEVFVKKQNGSVQKVGGQGEDNAIVMAIALG